jgi:hypothetical protein
MACGCDAEEDKLTEARHGFALEGLVDIGHICLMMFIMVDLHGHFVNMGLQFGIAKWKSCCAPYKVS